VLFDSADVLVDPATRSDAPVGEAWKRWFLPDAELSGLDEALARGMAYLDDRHASGVYTIAEERDVFTRFYAVVLDALGVVSPPRALREPLARAKVDDERFELFEEVLGVLPRLRGRSFLLGVLTEGWPSLLMKYERLGIASLFDAVVISSQEALLKDDPRLFEIASDRLRLPPRQLLYVDDWPPHVEKAMAAGFRGAVIAPGTTPTSSTGSRISRASAISRRASDRRRDRLPWSHTDIAGEVRRAGPSCPPSTDKPPP
jgi:putative hydrolase of the HAD superfamily